MGVKREAPSPSPAAAKRPKPEAPAAAAPAGAVKRATPQRAKPAAALATESPFPRLLRPTPQECDVAVRTLRGAHGRPCSQPRNRASDANALLAFQRFMAT